MVTLSGGQNLEKALAKIATNVQTAMQVDVGFLADATYPDGTPVAMVAAIQEFGAPSRGIPPRPFFRTMIANKSPEWPKAVGDLLVANKYDGKKTLGQVGAAIDAQLKESIIATNEPALSPVTVMLRGMRSQKRYQGMKFGAKMAEAIQRVADGKTNYGASAKPLVDTGVLLRSVSYLVK